MGKRHMQVLAVHGVHNEVRLGQTYRRDLILLCLAADSNFSLNF